MNARFFTLYESVVSSYWFIPGSMTVFALGLSYIMPEMERSVASSYLESISWTYSGGADGARTVMATIAASMIGVAGVAFSVTIVTLILATNQFGPRLLRNFMRDKGNQIVLGSLFATFLYCLMILRQIVGSDVSDSNVPNFSVTFGVFMVICSLGLLIYFIHHIAESIQAPNVLASVNHDIHLAMKHLFPKEIDLNSVDENNLLEVKKDLDEKFTKDSISLKAEESGYIQRLNIEDLLENALDKDLIINILRRPGQFVTKGQIVMQVHPGKQVDQNTLKKLSGTYDVDVQRTIAQDVEFAIHQLVEVAVRALSPGINDPFTAMQCLSWLGDALSHLANREIPTPFQADEKGQVRVIAYPITFEGMVNAAFDMIRQNSEECTAVMFKIMETIQTVLSQTRYPRYRDYLFEYANIIYQQGRKNIENDYDLRELEKRHQCFIDAYKNI